MKQISMKVLMLFTLVLSSIIIGRAQEQREVKGEVVDLSTGNPIEGATISSKGDSKVRTQSDSRGMFVIKVSPQTASLQVSYIGYTSQEVSITDNLRISLVSENQELNEVVVVGYGTAKKLNVSGSVNTVDTKLITNRSTTSLTNALQGTTPGLTIIQRPGDVGGDIGSVNIRGRGNLGTSSPLYVVDNVIVTNEDFARINPMDVENMSVLKDADAAVYGSRAAYGVILVTTKKGKNGKATIEYNMTVGSQRPTVLPKFLGAVDYATLRNEAAANAGTQQVYTEEQIQKMRDGSDPDNYPNNDWLKLVLKPSAPIQQHDINIAGGSDKVKYFVGSSYFNQGSLVPGKDLNRYTFRVNSTAKVNEILDIGTNISFIRDGYQLDGGDVNFVALYRMVPTMVSVQSDGNWGSINAGNVDATLGTDNPLRTLAQGGRSNYNTNRLIGSINATLRPTPGMTVDGMISYNYYNNQKEAFVATQDPLINFITKESIAGTGNTINNLTNTWNMSGNLMAQLYASYEKRIDKHFGKIMLGSSYEDYTEKKLEAKRNMFPNNNLNAIDVGSTANGNVFNAGNTLQRAFNSVFGRVNYSYDEKYILQAILRADASSQFAQSSRLGYFPSVSAGWVISKEEFMKNISWISDLKIRGSYGLTGNVNNVGYYDYFDALATGTAAILDQGRVDGVWPNLQANNTITWESVLTKNMGLDGSLFKNRVTFQLDVFDKLTKGILLKLPQPIEYGLSEAADNNQLPSTNAAKVQNKGVEFNLTYNNKIGELDYYIGGNLSKVWNKVIDLNGQNNQISSPYIFSEGQSIGTYYLYQSEGLFRDQADVDNHATQFTGTKPGDIKYRDINGDGKIDPSDRTFVGNDVPYFTYGLNGGINYKGFDFNFLAQGVTNVKVNLTAESSQAFFNGAGAKAYTLDRWTTSNPNPNALYPRVLIAANNSQNLQGSDFWLFDASYFRIKALTLGYTFPSELTNKVSIQKLRLFVTSTNPITIRGDQRMKDFDPEAASSRAAYPQLKSYSFGLNVTF